MENKTRILIMGAAGRDFHNFNVAFRDNPHYEVIRFTATQIPNIAGGRCPPIYLWSQFAKSGPEQEKALRP